jgi:hypothetical protein
MVKALFSLALFAAAVSAAPYPQDIPQDVPQAVEAVPDVAELQEFDALRGGLGRSRLGGFRAGRSRLGGLGGRRGGLGGGLGGLGGGLGGGNRHGLWTEEEFDEGLAAVRDVNDGDPDHQHPPPSIDHGQDTKVKRQDLG